MAPFFSVASRFELDTSEIWPDLRRIAAIMKMPNRLKVDERERFSSI
jgi:hypothetical protein